MVGYFEEMRGGHTSSKSISAVVCLPKLISCSCGVLHDSRGSWMLSKLFFILMLLVYFNLMCSKSEFPGSINLPIHTCGRRTLLVERKRECTEIKSSIILGFLSWNMYPFNSDAFIGSGNRL